MTGSLHDARVGRSIYLAAVQWGQCCHILKEGNEVLGVYQRRWSALTLARYQLCWQSSHWVRAALLVMVRRHLARGRVA